MELGMHPSNGVQNPSSPDIWSLDSGVSTSNFRKPASQSKQSGVHGIDLIFVGKLYMFYIDPLRVVETVLQVGNDPHHLRPSLIMCKNKKNGVRI